MMRVTGISDTTLRDLRTKIAMPNGSFAARIATLLICALPGAAWAQEAQTPVPELDLGEPVPVEGEAAPQQPQDDGTYIRETEGDWAIQCLRVPEGQEEPCQMYQLLRDEQDNSVAEVSIFQLQPGGQVVAGGTFVVPLETLLTEKMTIQVDSGQAKRYDFSFCTRIGCYARVGFTEADINAFRRGAVAKVTIVPALAPDQKVTLDMSLTGFTAGYAKVPVAAQAN